MLPYDKIKVEILNGTLPPGTRLREEEIAKRLKRSRTPIREAIRRLATEELVTFSPNKGATVREYSLEDIKHAYNLRALIEGYGASLAAKNYDSPLLSELEKCNENYRVTINNFLGLEVKDDSQLVQLIESNRKFHDLIFDLSQNKYITQMSSSLITLPLTFQSFYWFSEHEFQNSVVAHQNITEAIMNGEADQANALMTTHVLRGRDYVLESVLKKKDSTWN